MSKKKYYAVKIGRVTGIFDNWDECKASVDSYSGADYKSFTTKQEAEQYLKNESECITTDSANADNNKALVAYVDGSFKEQAGRYSFGCILLTPDGDVIKESGSNNDPQSIQHRNVAGEMLGAMYAVKWGEMNGYRALRIYYDYTGIEKWVTGEWKAKTDLTKKYADYMIKMNDKINITFEKVEAHTGNVYNEEADRLAKKALEEEKGIPKIKKGGFWFTVSGVKLSDIEAIIQLVEEEIKPDILTVSEKSMAYGKSMELKVSKKDKVVISYYNKGDKVVVQGKPERLFSLIISYVTELVDVEEIPKIFNDTYSIDIAKEDIKHQFQYYLPNAYEKLPEKMSRTLHQAIYNLRLNGDMFDGTFLAHPVLRAIDGHIKMILLAYNIIHDWKYISKYGYDMFEKVNTKYVLRADRCGTASDKQIKYIENCYTFFNMNRNKLSHWDDATQPLDTTKLLSVEEAHSLIKRTLQLIDEYYQD